MKLEHHARWLLPLALLVGTVPLVLRERNERLQKRMPGQWREEKTAGTIQIAPPDGANLLTVIPDGGKYGFYFYQIVNGSHIRVIDGIGGRWLAKVSISSSGDEMTITRESTSPVLASTKNYSRVK